MVQTIYNVGWVAVDRAPPEHVPSFTHNAERTMTTRTQLIEAFHQQTHHQGWFVADEDFPADGQIDGEFYPHLENIFFGLGGVSPDKVRYLILGQDPYPDADKEIPQATGLAFDVDIRCLPSIGNSLPQSLSEIMRNLRADKMEAQDAVLAYRQWVTRNHILMLNSALTYKPNVKNTYRRVWENFLISIIRQARYRSRYVKFVAWGSDAKKLLSKALNDGTPFAFAGHPKDRNGSKSFREFWTHGLGLELRKLAV